MYDFKGCLLLLLHPVSEIFLFIPFQVFEHIGFYVDGEIPALSETKRYPVETHFPAVQIAVNIEGGIGKVF